MSRKPKLGVFKFASCDGCQLSLLDAEADLLGVAQAVDIAYFLEATSRIEPGPYDIALVEGSITTPHDRERIQQIREDAALLVTIGACATAGGIQALRNWADCDDFVRSVYAHPEYIDTLSTSTAIADHVAVDFELRGCPVNQKQLTEVIRSLLGGRMPRTPVHSVCMDCKQSGAVCIVVAQGKPCLGPVTQAGCGVICPSYDRGCYGCFGPSLQANASSLSNTLLQIGVDAAQQIDSFRNFNGAAPAFQQVSDQLEQLLQRQESERREGDSCD